MPKKPTRRTRPGLSVVKRKGSQALYLRGTIGKVHVFESLRTDDPKIAEQARIRREYELQHHAVHGTKPDVTFSAAVVAYTQAEERSAATLVNLRKLVSYFGPGTTCRQIDQVAIDEAGKALCPGSKPVTIQRQVTTPVSAVLNHASRRGWCDVPRFDKPKGGGKRTDWLRPAEAEAMIEGAAPHFRPILVFLFCTGARVGEVVALTWDDVDLQHARCTLRETKNGDDRIVDLPPRAVAALGNLTGREGHVFRRPDGDRYRQTDEGPLGAYGGQFAKAWAAALRAAKITKHLTPHHARHSFATWHYCVHKDLIRLQQDGGWHTITMTTRYAKLAPDGLRDEIAAFWGVGAGEGRAVARLA